MNDMTFKEAYEMKKQAEREIAKIIQDFHNTTGLSVRSIDCHAIGTATIGVALPTFQYIATMEVRFS